MSSETKPPVAGETSEPELPILRFSLKHLFWAVTGIAALLTVLVMAPAGMSSLALILAVMVVVLHVSGTAIGTRMSRHANERRAWEAARTEGEFAPNARVLAGSPSRSPLHGHDRPLRHLRLCIAAGAVFGGILGAAVLGATIGQRVTLAGVAVGAMSMAVLGAWMAFVGASSWAILRRGWRDAVTEGGGRNDRGDAS